MNITITILDIIIRPVFYLKHYGLEIGLPPSSDGTYSDEISLHGPPVDRQNPVFLVVISVSG
jgi:hypothetical protein